MRATSGLVTTTFCGGSGMTWCAGPLQAASVATASRQRRCFMGDFLGTGVPHSVASMPEFFQQSARSRIPARGLDQPLGVGGRLGQVAEVALQRGQREEQLAVRGPLLQGRREYALGLARAAGGGERDAVDVGERKIVRRELRGALQLDQRLGQALLAR